jgi:UDP-glucose 4-epimerase
MTKSLVTGGAGFIGSHIVDKLIELGHEVIVIDNESAESNEEFYWNDKAQNHKHDIRDYENTRPLYEGVDYVFHTAAEARIQPAILNPIEAVSINCVGTVTVLQCAREAGVKKVMYSSTSSGYGFNEPPNDETQRDDCLNPYSVSKVSGEKLCSMYTSLKMDKNKAAYKLKGLPPIYYINLDAKPDRCKVYGRPVQILGD